MNKYIIGYYFISIKSNHELAFKLFSGLNITPKFKVKEGTFARIQRNMIIAYTSYINE